MLSHLIKRHHDASFAQIDLVLIRLFRTRGRKQHVKIILLIWLVGLGLYYLLSYDAHAFWQSSKLSKLLRFPLHPV